MTKVLTIRGSSEPVVTVITSTAAFPPAAVVPRRTRRSQRFNSHFVRIRVSFMGNTPRL